MPAPRKYPVELRERAIRLAFESGRPLKHVADDLGVGGPVAVPLVAPGGKLNGAIRPARSSASAQLEEHGSVGPTRKDVHGDAAAAEHHAGSSRRASYSHTLREHRDRSVGRPRDRSAVGHPHRSSSYGAESSIRNIRPVEFVRHAL